MNAIMQTWPTQQLIWTLRLRGVTVEQIRLQVNQIPGVHICNDEAVLRCIKATAMGYQWSPQGEGGAWPYLCPDDERTLVQTIRECNANLDSLPVSMVLNLAHDLRGKRVAQARDQLIRMGHPRLAASIEDPEEPDRTWANHFAERHNLRLKNCEWIEQLRRLRCDKVSITEWFVRFGGILRQYHQDHVFNMDETGLSTNRKYRVMVPRGAHGISPGGDKNIHITGIVCYNRVGTYPKPGIILPGVKNLPAELRDFADNADFYSSPTGWITNDVFGKWAINFAHWVAHWRKTLPPDRAGRRVLLIMDGHTTRRNVDALWYMYNFGIDVLTLPGHCSHVLQPFDVGIAAPLKAAIRKQLTQIAAVVRTGVFRGWTQAAVKRFVLVSAFLESLPRALTPMNARSSFSKTGIWPVNLRVALQNHLAPLPLDARPKVPEIQNSMLIDSVEQLQWLADVTGVPICPDG